MASLNNTTRFIALIFLIVVIIYLIQKSNLKEGFLPWVWNIPTRDLYPKTTYDFRCVDRPQVIHHIYNNSGFIPGYGYTTNGGYTNAFYYDYANFLNTYYPPRYYPQYYYQPRCLELV